MSTKGMKLSRRSRKHRVARDRQIFMDYTGVNSSHERVPATVLAKQHRMSRARVYQIIHEQQQAREAGNMRVSSRLKNTEADAAVVAEMLEALLGA